MSFSVSEIISWTGGRVVNAGELGAGLDQIRIVKPTMLNHSSPEDIAFFFSKSYQNELPLVKAGVLITGEAFVAPLTAAGLAGMLPLWKKTAVIACEDPYLAMAVISEKLVSSLSTQGHLEPGGEKSIHPTAVVDPSAQIGAGVKIGAHVVVERDSKIGDGSVLYPGTYIGPAVKMGRQCILFAGVKVYEWTQMGDHVRIHAGAVIGSDGFGYAPRRKDGLVTGHQKIFHLGRVVIGNHVEIGANACVDRGTFGNTVLGDHVKLDNLVQIGHNVRLDEGAVICGSSALAGSSSVGRYAYIGGLTGVANQVHVGDRAQVGAVSLMTKDVPPGTAALGNPQREYREHFRAHAALNKLAGRKRGEKS